MMKNEVSERAGHEANAALVNYGAQEHKKVIDAFGRGVCPECGAPLRFGSRDPCEGDYYWCSGCGDGPILFPLYHRMPRVIAQQPIIDAEKMNASIAMVEQLRGRAA